MNFFQALKDLVLSLWPWANTKAREDAARAGEAAAAQVKTLEDARKASEDRQ